MNFEDLKELIEEIKSLEKQKHIEVGDTYNFYDKYGEGSGLDSGLVVRMCLENSAIVMKRYNDKMRELKQQLKEHSFLFDVKVGDLIDEIIKQFNLNYPNIIVNPNCEIQGVYLEADQSKSVDNRVSRSIDCTFKGHVDIVLEFDNNSEPFKLGSVERILTYNNKLVFVKFREICKRKDIKRNVQQYENTELNILDFLLRDNYHRYYKTIQIACYNLVERNIKLLNEETQQKN